MVDLDQREATMNLAQLLVACLGVLASACSNSEHSAVTATAAVSVSVREPEVQKAIGIIEGTAIYTIPTYRRYLQAIAAKSNESDPNFKKNFIDFEVALLNFKNYRDGLEARIKKGETIRDSDPAIKRLLALAAATDNALKVLQRTVPSIEYRVPIPNEKFDAYLGGKVPVSD